MRPSLVGVVIYVVVHGIAVAQVAATPAGKGGGKAPPVQAIPDTRGTEQQPLVVRPVSTPEEETTLRSDRASQNEAAKGIWAQLEGIHTHSGYGTLIAILLLLVASVQAFLFIKQLQDLKRATSLAGKNANAARRMAIAAERTLRMTMRAEAPFLIPQVITTQHFQHPAGQNRPRFVYAFRNEGKSPAIIRRFQDRFRCLPALPEQDDEAFGGEPFEERPAQYIAVGLGQTLPGFLEMNPHLVPLGEPQNTNVFVCRLEPADLAAYNQEVDANRRFLIGRVEYEDRFGVRRRQGFCFRLQSAQPLRVVRFGGDQYNYDRELEL